MTEPDRNRNEENEEKVPCLQTGRGWGERTRGDILFREEGRRCGKVGLLEDTGVSSRDILSWSSVHGADWRGYEIRSRTRARSRLFHRDTL